MSMTRDNPLAQHTATADTGAGFLATREHALAMQADLAGVLKQLV